MGSTLLHERFPALFLHFNPHNTSVTLSMEMGMYAYLTPRFSNVVAAKLATLNSVLTIIDLQPSAPDTRS
jgi:hypothetical protein